MRPPPHFMKPALRPPFSSPLGEGKKRKTLSIKYSYTPMGGKEGGRAVQTDQTDRQDRGRPTDPILYIRSANTSLPVFFPGGGGGGEPEQ